MKTSQYPKKQSALLARLLPIVFMIAASGCFNIRLIAEYDEQIDIAVTAFQKKMETFLTSLERNAGKSEAAYENNVKFYDEAKVDLSAIRLRASATPKNEITIKQIDLLSNSLKNLESLHKLGITAEQINPLRTAFNTSCAAILKLEIAKKRGESSSNKSK